MRVYVAGPISKGDQFINCRNAIIAAGQLLDMGHSPFVPHLYAFFSVVTGHADYEQWMKLDQDFLDICEAVVRIPGDSPGADRECARAEEKGIPVYYGVTEFARDTANN